MTAFAARTSPRIALSAILFAVLSACTNGTAFGLPFVNRVGGCTHDIECEDGMACTVDRCDFPPGGPAGAGVCMHDSVGDGQPGGVGGPDCAQKFGLLCGGCDDGVFCNGVETCQGGACAAGTPPCTGGQVCSESLNLCQPGPCSAQKTCIGGPTPGAVCTTNFGCGNGGRCGFADCDDGILCNGDENCVAGVCQGGENPCGHGASCGERQCSSGPNVDICLTDADCLTLGTCSLLGPVCLPGRCCVGSTEPSCTRRLKNGVCSGSTPGTNSGAACTVNSDCRSNSCTGFPTSCDGQGGDFYGHDAGTIPPGGGPACPINSDITVKCPKYGSGIAPNGAYFQAPGPISNSPVVVSPLGVALQKLGDDYAFSNTGVCVGGSRDGLGCADNPDCSNGGSCNLAGPSVMSVYYIRMLGGFFPNTEVVVEFRDSAERFVAESYAQRDTVAELERLWLNPPVIVPSKGFVVLHVASEFTPNGGFVWASTEAVDVGSNNPDLLWVNDGPVANFLAPNPGILAFEIEGDKVAAPLGACCDLSGTGCTDGVLPWVCEDVGNIYQGVGTTCPVQSCDAGACCNPNTGDCMVVAAQGDCTTAGGDFQGFGTDCEPDCCTQPLVNFSGADRCEDVTIHVVTVPPIGETNVITITGDNSAATLQPGETPCYGGSETPPVELGWFEAFEFVGCAMIRVDYCCTDPVKRPAYHALFNDCPCSAPIFSNANPYQFPQPDHAAGTPYCDDDNEWATFGPLPPGPPYYIPIRSSIPGSFGPYQIHITAEACPTAACCVADQCTDDVNQLQCDALGGTFLAPPQKVPAVNDCSSTPCATGSCCSGPGQCFDFVAEKPVTPADCSAVQGTYIGGIPCRGGICSGSAFTSCSTDQQCVDLGVGPTCNGDAQALSQPLPCPLCSIEGTSNCQPFDNALNFTLSDRHVGSDGMLAADDFRPNGSMLDHVCVWGFYLDSDPETSVNDCDPAVATDQFRVRVFANDPNTGRSPGALVGTSTATSQRGILPNTLIWTRLQSNVYGFELVLDTPITGLTQGEIYWIEVSNDVSDSLSTCIWFWNQRAPGQNSYSFNGNENGYPDSNATPFSNTFCLNMSISPSTLGTLLGACCNCDGACSLKTLDDCDKANGVWDITTTTCTGVTCPSGPPPNDNCIDGPPTITAGSYVINNQCATTDGYGPFPEIENTSLDFDLWYYFIAPTSCDLAVSECQTGLRFNSALAVYINCPPGAPGGCDPTACSPCPLTAVTTVEHLAGLIQDESCTGDDVGGAGMWRASEQIDRDALPGECFLIRVGSFPGERGTAILDIACDNDVICDPECALTPFIGTRFISMCGVVNPCLTPNSMVGAIRVHLTSLHHVNPPYTGGASIPFTAFEGQVRWVGPPSQYVESTANPTPFWASKLQCTPHYQDWSDVPEIFVTGPEIVPSSSYDYEMLKPSCTGVEATCTAVSPTFTVKTTRWGDVETPYNPPEPSTQPDLADISALVNKFRSAPGAPAKARALLAGVDQFGNVNIAPDFDFSHIAACVDAFRGRPYPYAVSACP